MSLPFGTQLGPYELQAAIGAGGMGEVYKARDTRLNRTVAIKVSNERFSERFEREARTIASLTHPNICTVFDVGPNYLVMEYLEGQPLRGPLPLASALRYAAQAADALHAAHVKGVVHRDFKPANVLITKTGVKLLDFGLAKIAAQAAAAGDNTATIADALTKENTILGTLQYMSPEQLEGKPADARSDIFAFGLVLYEAITGKAPFTASSQASLIAAIMKEEPPVLSATQPLAPPALDRVIQKCLAKDPDARWQTAADLRDELLWIVQSSAAPAKTALTAVTARRRVPQWGVAAVALAIGITAGVLLQNSHTPTAPAWVATRLSGPPTANTPVVSPDGQLVAFLTMVDNLTQVAVMKPDGSSWTLLTNQRGAGYAVDLAWSPDGGRIYFSRYFDRPRGVYSVPALGGDPTLLVENAAGGAPLPDGSLLIAKVIPNGETRLFRMFPEAGRMEPLPALLRHADHAGVSVIPGGKQIAFYGVFETPGGPSGTAGFYVLDLATRKAHIVGASLTPSNYNPLIAAMSDGKSLIVLARAEELEQVVKVPADGGAGKEVLFSLPGDDLVNQMDVGRDGSIFLDIWHRPTQLLRFSEAGGDPTQALVPYDMEGVGFGVSPAGKNFVEGTIGGKRRLLTSTASGDWRPFVQTSEETGGAFSVSAGGRIAFLIGARPSRQVGIASAIDGRIVGRVALDDPKPESLALSPDGRTLYYAAKGYIWSLAVTGPAKPKQLIEGNRVSIAPSGEFLYVEQLAKDPPGVVRVALADGSATPVALPNDLRPTIDGFGANPVDARGRVLIEVASADSFYYSAAIYDPSGGTVTRVPLRFEGDIWVPSWAPDGHIMALGARYSSSIWRYHEAK